MQTGYDNFWMYQNNRPEPVQNLPKIDGYSHPVITNNYKQMHNGRYPHNTYYTPSNNVSRSQNGQYNLDPCCMWPSSVYSLPFNSSYANNFQSQMFPTQTNNFNYSSQISQAKPAMRNSNLIEIQKNNYNQSKVTNRLPQISSYTDTDNARIRVKDVFTLNNNSIYNSVLENNVAPTQKSKQYEYSTNHASNNCNRTCDFETNESVVKHIPSSYVQREQPCLSDQQQFLQYSDTSYNQNAQFSAVSQAQSSNSNQTGSNLQPVDFNSRFILAQMLNEKEVQNNLSNTLEGNKRVTGKANETNHFSGLKTVSSHINTERNNNINYRDLSKANETYSSYTSGFNVVQNQNQVNLRNTDEAYSLSRSSSTEGSKTETSNTVSFSNSRINSLENNVVKITIPHTGQSTFIQLNGLRSDDKNSSLSLPSLHNETLSKSNAPNSIPLPERAQARRQSCNTSPGTNQSRILSPLTIPNDSSSTTKNSKYSYCNTNPDCRVGQESLNKHFLSPKHCSENTSENFGVNISTKNGDSIEFRRKSLAESMPREEIMTIKQELLGLDDPSMQLHQNITIEEDIKTEKYAEHDIEHEPLSSKNPSLPSEDINYNKREESAVSRKIVDKSKTECKNGDPEVEIPRKILNKENKTGENSTVQKENLEKAKEKNYVSKINRDKLDLLIQFLKKEDENKTKKSEGKDSADSLKETSSDIKKKKEIVSTRSRRKICKTDIVKNKNNSREMVSLRSHKTSRAETKESLKRPQTAKKEEEKKICSDEVYKNEKPVDFSEDTKPCNSSQDTAEQKSCDSKSEPVFVSGQTKESSVDEEKNIISIMQALQNLKTHFCLSCTLVSPVDSFWINVVSGELRCLNCFKKMNLKVDENIFKIKRTCSDDCNKDDAKPPPHEKTQKGYENKKDSTENSCKSKCECEKLFESTKAIEERSCTSKPTEMFDATSRKKSSEEQKKIGESDEKDNFSFKTENSTKIEAKAKRKLSLKEEFFPDKIQNLEEKTSPKIRKKSSPGAVNTSKQWVDSPGKKIVTKEEKAKAHYDNLKKEKKPFSHLGEKFTSKEQYVKTSKESLEQETEKKDKKQSSQSRKRTSSKEEVGHHKVRIPEEEAVSAMRSPSKECCDSCKLHFINELSDKSKSSSKDICTDHKSKILSKHPKTSPVEDSEKKNISNHINVEKSGEHLPKKRKQSLEEDSVPRKVHIAEDLTKYSKQCSDKSKNTNSTKADDSGSKHRTSEHSKHHVPDFDLSRKKSKDDGLASKTEGKNFTECDKTRRNSTLKENLNSSPPKKELKYKRLILENYEKDKKTFFGRIPKISRKSNETVGSEANKSPQNDEKYQKSVLSTKPLKESQRTEDEMKASALNEIFNKKKECHENKHKHKESQKGTTEKKKSVTIIQDNFEKKEKIDKGHNVKQTKKEKALECVFGKKKEDLVLKEYRKSPEKPPSAKLLEKLFEKTKKLSWTLLGES